MSITNFKYSIEKIIFYEPENTLLPDKYYSFQPLEEQTEEEYVIKIDSEYVVNIDGPKLFKMSSIYIVPKNQSLDINNYYNNILSELTYQHLSKHVMAVWSLTDGIIIKIPTIKHLLDCNNRHLN